MARRGNSNRQANRGAANTYVNSLTRRNRNTRNPYSEYGQGMIEAGLQNQATLAGGNLVGNPQGRNPGAQPFTNDQIDWAGIQQYMDAVRRQAEERARAIQAASYSARMRTEEARQRAADERARMVQAQSYSARARRDRISRMSPRERDYQRALDYQGDKYANQMVERLDRYNTYWNNAEARGGGGIRASERRPEAPNYSLDSLMQLDERLRNRNTNARRALTDLLHSEDRNTIAELMGEDYLAQIQEIRDNADAFRGDQLETVYNQLIGEINAEVENFNSSHQTGGGLRDRFMRGLGNAQVANVIEAISKPWDELVAQPYYAAQLGEREGNSWSAFASGLASFVPFWDGAYESDVNSYDKRADLTNQGRLTSFGQRVFGDFGPDWEGGGIHLSASSLADLAANVADPVDIVGASALRGLGRVGTRAGAAGIRRAAMREATGFTERLLATANPHSFLWSRGGQDAVQAAAMAQRSRWLEGATGRGLVEAANDLVDNTLAGNLTPDDVRRMLNRGNSRATQSVAQSIVEANTREGRLRAILDAFVDGRYQPAITVRRQVLARAGMTSAVGSAGVPILFGQGAIRTSRGMRGILEKAARGDLNNVFIGRTRNTGAVISEGARRAAEFTTQRLDGDYWREVVAPRLPKSRQGSAWNRAHGLQLRYERLADINENWHSLLPLEDELEGSIKGYVDDLLTEEFKRLDGAVRTNEQGSLDWAESHLAQLESFISMLQGEGGLAAKQAALMQLRAGYTRNVTTLTSALTQAQRVLGRRRNPAARARDFVAEGKAAARKVGGLDVKPLTAERLTRLKRSIERQLQDKIVTNARFAKLLATNMGQKLSPGQEAQLRALLESVADAQARLANLPLEVQDRAWALYDDNILDLITQLDLNDLERAKILDEALANHIESLADAAIKNFGRLDLGDTLAVTPENITSLRLRMTPLPQVIKDELDAELAAGIADGGGLNDLIGLARQVELLRAHPDIMEETRRLLENRNLRMRSEIGDATRGGPNVEAQQFTRAGIARGPSGLNPIRGAARVALAITESRAPTHIRFESTGNRDVTVANRTQDMDRYLQALHFNTQARTEMTRRMMRRNLTELDIKEDVEMVYAAFAVREGVDPDEFVRAIRAKWEGEQRAFGIIGDVQLKRGGLLRRKDARIVGGEKAVELAQDVQVVSQKAEGISLLEPDEMYRMMRDLKTNGGRNILGNPLQAARAGFGRVADKPILGLSRNGRDLTARYIARKGHSFWKVAVVTNLHTAAIGAVGGYIYTDGDPQERLSGALRWGALGAAGSVRYIGRVAGIEEGFRKAMQGGFTPHELVPYWARWRATRDKLLPFRLNNEVGAWNHPLEVFENAWLRSVGDDWVAVPRGDSRFIDAWWRVVNYQIHPDTDPVTRLLLEAKAGRRSLDEAHELIDDWLAGPEGQTFLRRIRDTKSNQSGSKAAIVDRYQRFLDHHIPTPDLARLRLDAAEVGVHLDRKVFKNARKEGHAPKVIHAQETWRVPKNARQALYTTSTLYRAVLETPTAKMNRIPVAQRIYRDDYHRLVRGGMDPTMAREVAEQSAIETTNRVMFRQDDQSRFAEAVDIFFPFQQPREEMLRVYAQMFMNNKARVAQMVRLGAVAFNNGEESGVFQKDPFTGNWVMRVPGSMWLSDLLGVGGVNWYVSPWDLTFLLRGMEGSPAQWGTGEAWDVLKGVAPTPGGPYWSTVSRIAFNRMPDLHDRVYGTPVYDWLFPFGSTGAVFTPFSRRMWMAMSGSVPPWEFASKVEMENELRRYQQEVYLQLIWEHLQENPGDTTWTPDLADVRKGTQDLLTVWSVLSAVTPATVRQRMRYESEFEALKEGYTDERGNLDFAKFMDDFPELSPFVTATGEWHGPETYQWWSREDEEGWEQWALHNKRRLSIESFDQNIREARRVQRMWDDYRRALSTPYSADRARALNAFYDQWGEEFNLRDEYHQVESIHDIIMRTGPGPQRENALNNWRLEMQSRGVDISWRKFQDLRRKAESFVSDPWRESASGQEIHAEVQRRMNRGESFTQIFNELSPVEQLKWLQQERATMGYRPGMDAGAFMDLYNEYGRQMGEIYDANPHLLSNEYDTGPNAAPVNVQRWRNATRAEVSRLYDSISRLSAARDLAYEEKRWTEWRMLRDQVRQARDNLREYQNELYRNGPEGLDELQAELRGNVQLGAGMNEQTRRMFDRLGVPYYESNEEMDWLNKSEDAQAAYLANLANSLSLEVSPGQYVPGKVYWEWMTEFQKDLLRRNFMPEQIEDWMGEAANRTGSDNDRRRWGWSSSWRRPVNNPNDGTNALYYAYDLMRFYNQRGNRKAPAAYQAYLALPDNPAVRADFLRKNPDVAEWIRLGPLANMPEIYRYLVIDIMVRNGKWEGEPRDIGAIADIAWAREQLNRWNMRGNSLPPETYDIWLNMPTGQAKAEYLQAHPEIGEWLRLGPMRNMPEAYQEVVRDIMLRYGEWTESQDPLGKTLSDFYKTPQHLKDAFLEAHPELSAYFAAMRSPEEQRMFELAEGYYALPDAGARRAYLAAHPELNSYFIEQRTGRYERFMNQVAIYMGQNPELFTAYLERQEDILNEMLHRFAEPSLVRELRSATRMSTTKTGRSRGTSGRRRAV